MTDRTMFEAPKGWPGDVCECPSMPIMMWRLPEGVWIIGAKLADNQPETDAKRYDEWGCTGAVLLCPDCVRVYAAMETPRT